MPEYRKDIILNEWVIIATERAKRPENFKEQIVKVENKALSVCPFDSGNESMTPPESMRIDSSGNEVDKDIPWQIRVVPNKYPAVVPNARRSSQQYGPYLAMDGFGIHEVVIQSPRHITNISELSLQQMELLTSVYIRRIRTISKDNRIESVVIMLNQGKEAGASLEHSHSQIVALPLTPPVLMNEISRTRDYFNRNHSCAMCDIINFEIKEDKRVVYENKEFLILQPYASRNPFETWIVPKRHDSNFENISSKGASSFTHCLKALVDFFHADLNNPPFNYYIHTGTFGSTESSHFHWHLELEPKLSIKAGFEIATGMDICITTPEYTAEYMKAGGFFKF